MTIQQTNLITPKTAAATSEDFYLDSRDVAITLVSIGYTGTEKSTIQIKDPQSGTYLDTSLTLDTTNGRQTIMRDAGTYRVNKGVTTSAVAVTLLRMK